MLSSLLLSLLFSALLFLIVQSFNFEFFLFNSILILKFLLLNQFTPSWFLHQHTLVWIRFTSLNVPYYHESALRTISSVIERPVKVDVVSTNGDRGKFARVCMEIDLSRPVIKHVKVEDQWQAVEYESLLLICGRCNCYGHDQRVCTVMEDVAMKDTVKEDLSLKDKVQVAVAEHGKNTTENTSMAEENPVKPKGISNSN